MSKLYRLHKQCRRYYLKKAFFVLGLLGIVGGAGYWGYGYWQDRTIQNEQKLAQLHPTPPTSISKPHPKQQPKPRSKPKAYALQIGAYNITATQTIDYTRKRLARIGVDECFVFQNAQKGLAYLRCGCYATKEPLLQLQERLRAKGWQTFIVASACEPKRSPKRSQATSTKQRANEPKDQKDKPSTEQLAQKSVVKERPLQASELEQLFAKRPSYALALKLATLYYHEGAFDKAIHWAKEANKLDSSKPEAWIYYAKSLYAQGNKRAAIDVLRFYLNFQNSDAVRDLIRKWNDDL